MSEGVRRHRERGAASACHVGDANPKLHGKTGPSEDPIDNLLLLVSQPPETTRRRVLLHAIENLPDPPLPHGWNHHGDGTELQPKVIPWNVGHDVSRTPGAPGYSGRLQVEAGHREKKKLRQSRELGAVSANGGGHTPSARTMPAMQQAPRRRSDCRGCRIKMRSLARGGSALLARAQLDGLSRGGSEFGRSRVRPNGREFRCILGFTGLSLCRVEPHTRQAR